MVVQMTLYTVFIIIFISTFIIETEGILWGTGLQDSLTKKKYWKELISEHLHTLSKLGISYFILCGDRTVTKNSEKISVCCRANENSLGEDFQTSISQSHWNEKVHCLSKWLILVLDYIGEFSLSLSKIVQTR